MSMTDHEIAILDEAASILYRETKKGDAMTSPSLVRDFARCKMHGLEHEVFSVMFLDTQHRVISYQQMFRGTIDSASVYPREIIKEALKQNAAAIIILHNHPSGEATPSDADRRITRRIQDAAGLMNIRVLDHLVVGSPDIASFAENGWI